MGDLLSAREAKQKKKQQRMVVTDLNLKGGDEKLYIVLVNLVILTVHASQL